MRLSPPTVWTLLLMLIPGFKPAHATVLDQFHHVNPGGGSVGRAVAHDQSAYQTFTAGFSGTLTRIDLGVYADTETVADLHVSIWHVDPSGGLAGLLSTSSVAASFIPLERPEAFALSTFSAVTRFVAGQSYAIELTT